MDERYALTPSQRKVWRNQLPTLAHGDQAKLARALAGAGKSAGTWRTRICNFVNGEASGLKAVFDEPKWLQRIAAHFGRTSADVEAWLATARGVPIADGPFDTRIPGFEGLGAVHILDCFYPPGHRETQFHLAARQDYRSSTGGTVNVDDIVAALAKPAPGRATAVVVIGAAGSGRGPLAKAIAARLERAGRQVTPWSAGAVVERHSVVLALNVDQCAFADRARLITETTRNEATLIVTTGENDAVADLPAERIACALRDGDEAWAIGYIEHLEERLAALKGHKVDLARLRAWFRDDPYALGMASRADTLGFLARHVVDGGVVPVRHRDFVGLAVRRHADLLRRDEQGGAALVLELCGEAVLGRAAEAACIAAEETVALADVARLLVDETSGLAGRLDGAWQALGPSGMIAVVEALVASGLFVRAGDRLRPSQWSVFVSALGARLAHRLDDERLVRAAVLDSRWQPALAAAVEDLGDPCPILAALDEQPMSVRCVAFPAYTRVLVAGGSASDVHRLETAFLRTLRWWACWPAEKRQLTATIGGPGRPAAPPATEALIGGVAPLPAMGIASRAHKQVMRASIEIDDLDPSVLDPAFVEYLALMGRPAVATVEQRRFALLVGAPFQSKEILDAQNWNALPGKEQRAAVLPYGLTAEECARWWRTVGALRLLEAPDGDARVAGTLENWSIAAGMGQATEGAAIWSAALRRRIEADDPVAPRAFADAVAFTVERWGVANFHALRDLFATIKSARRRRALREAASRGLPRDVRRWWLMPEFATWVLREIVDDELREELWTKCIALPSERVPWRCFLDAGLAIDRIAHWAAATVPDDEESSPSSLAPLQGGPDMFVAEILPPQRVPQAEALDYLVKEGSPQSLVAILSATRLEFTDWAFLARRRLASIAPDELRRHRLETAVAQGRHVRKYAINDLEPRRGEHALWQALAEAAPSHRERIVRHCQAACAADDDQGRWDVVREALAVIECVALGRVDGARKFSDVFKDTPGPAPDESANLEAIFMGYFDELSPELEVIFGEIGMVLVSGTRSGLSGVGEIVREVFESVTLRRLTVNYPSRAWWGLVHDLLGPLAVVEKLELGEVDQLAATARVARLNVLADIGLLDLVAGLLHHPMLGQAAVEVVARRTPASQPERLQRALDGLPLTSASGDVEPATALLVRRLTELMPDAAVSWLTTRLADEPPSVKERWWAQLVPAMAPGRPRERVLAQWFASRSSS